MKVAPGVLCYVKHTIDDEFQDQINGKVVTAVARTALGNWAIHPRLPIMLRELGQDLRGVINTPGLNYINALPEVSLIPIAGPGGLAVDEEREIERTDEAAAHHLLAYGGNNTSGPRDVASALSALSAHGGTGRHDFETETFVVHAFDARQSDVVQYGDKAGPLDTDGWTQAVAYAGESKHADAKEAGPIEALRALREADDPQAFREWCLGVVAQFWPQEVLRSEVHGRRFRRSAQPQRGLVNVALSRSQAGAVWSVQDLWEAGCDGRAPQGWQPHEQRARELGAYLSQLPQSPSPAERFVRCLRQSDEGIGLLREALAALQEARRSPLGEGQPEQSAARVRRLIVEECEALQGFPRGYTAIPFRGKPAADGPRYKALGNSWAINCVRWIGRRIAMVDAIPVRTRMDAEVAA